MPRELHLLHRRELGEDFARELCGFVLEALELGTKTVVFVRELAQLAHARDELHDGTLEGQDVSHSGGTLPRDGYAVEAFRIDRSGAPQCVMPFRRARPDAIFQAKMSRNTPLAGPARKPVAPSTVGRGRAVVRQSAPAQAVYADHAVSLRHADSLSCYAAWPTPTAIVSDGAYGVLGFEGDTSDHLDLPVWYEPHVAAWSNAASAATTLWFWNSEIGWAAAHPILEKYGFRYVNSNTWNKGVGHIAGNVNTQKIRRFPVVTEVCVQYVFEARVAGKPLKQWLLEEWKRTGLPLRRANEACGVNNAATRKYFDQGHLWYFPPPEAMQKLMRLCQPLR